MRFDPDEVRAVLREQSARKTKIDVAGSEKTQSPVLGFPVALQEAIGNLALPEKVALKRWIEREYL